MDVLYEVPPTTTLISNFSVLSPTDIIYSASVADTGPRKKNTKVGNYSGFLCILGGCLNLLFSIAWKVEFLGPILSFFIGYLIILELNNSEFKNSVMKYLV